MKKIAVIILGVLLFILQGVPSMAIELPFVPSLEISDEDNNTQSEVSSDNQNNSNEDDESNNNNAKKEQSVEQDSDNVLPIETIEDTESTVAGNNSEDKKSDETKSENVHEKSTATEGDAETEKNTVTEGGAEVEKSAVTEDYTETDETKDGSGSVVFIVTAVLIVIIVVSIIFLYRKKKNTTAGLMLAFGITILLMNVTRADAVELPFVPVEPEATATPTTALTAEPTATPTAAPTVAPTAEPTATPTAAPTVKPDSDSTPELPFEPAVELTKSPEATKFPTVTAKPGITSAPIQTNMPAWTKKYRTFIVDNNIKVLVNESNLIQGKALRIYQWKNNRYCMIKQTALQYRVSKDGSIPLSVIRPGMKGTYILVSSQEAKKINKNIKKRIRLKKTSISIKKGKTVSVSFASGSKSTDISKIRYVSSKKKVAAVTLKGKVTGKSQGKAVVKVTVQFKNKEKKIMRLKVVVR